MASSARALVAPVFPSKRISGYTLAAYLYLPPSLSELAWRSMGTEVDPPKPKELLTDSISQPTKAKRERRRKKPKDTRAETRRKSGKAIVCEVFGGLLITIGFTISDWQSSLPFIVGGLVCCAVGVCTQLKNHGYRHVVARLWAIGLVVIGLIGWTVVAVKNAKEDETLAIVKAMQRVQTESDSELLKQFPLGYVLFTATLRKEIIPLADSDSGFIVDWHSTKVSEITDDKVVVRFPNFTYPRMGLRAEGITLGLTRRKGSKHEGIITTGGYTPTVKIIENDPTGPIIALGFVPVKL